MMWIDDRGVAHTVSLPDPQRLMDSAFADSLAALVRLDSEDVEDAVAQAEEEVFESLEDCAIGVDAGSSPGATPPTQILRGAVHDVAQLHAAITMVEFRWRLDAVLALEDVIESLS